MKKLFLTLVAGALLWQPFAQKWQKNFDYVDECNCGVAKVKKDGKIGYVDIKGNIVIPLQFDEGMTFNEGYVAVRKGQNWAYIDSVGKFITEFVYEDAMGFSEGLAPVKKASGWGFINVSGKEAIPFVYTNARQFSEGLAAVSTSPKDFWGFINKKGEIIISCNLDFADSFTKDGEARVSKRGQWMWINKYNQKVRD
ncbi:MAG TPA: WG repeat-containing protein [Phnomibacter sp.]|nr:WG repeat-containing protein [Phnomibacter sp.]